MSSKKKKYLKILAIVLILAGGLHFVPVYSQKGDLSKDEACNGTNGPIEPVTFENDNYSLVLGGLGGFIDDKRYFVASSPTNYDGCAQHIRLRLYIL